MPQPGDPEATERLGHTIGDWTLDGILGIGGMATVYAAHGAQGEEVALKVLHRDIARQSEHRERFEQEGRLAHELDHRGVVRVIAAGTDPDCAETYLVMERLRGQTLEQILAAEDPITPEELLRIVDDVLDVLVVAHEAGVVHRDLKPENVFVTTEGSIKVLDFGVARHGASTRKYRTRAGVALGTVSFMAPEQALGKHDRVDGRTDLFAVGAMIFRALAARHIHQADSDAELLVLMASKPAPPLGTVAPHAAPGLAAVVDLSLAFSQESRYPDARTMQDDVRSIRKGKAPRYASKIASVRDVSTRVDMVAVPDSRPGRGDSPSSSRGGPASLEAPPLASPADVPPPSAPPVSLEAPSLVDPRPAAPGTQSTSQEQEPTSRAAPSAKSPARRTTAFWAFILIVLVAAGAGALLARGSSRAAPDAPLPTVVPPD